MPETNPRDDRAPGGLVPHDPMADLTIDAEHTLGSRERAELFERVSELCALGTPFTLHVVSSSDGVNVVDVLSSTNTPMSAYTRAARVLLYDSRGVASV